MTDISCSCINVPIFDFVYSRCITEVPEEEYDPRSLFERLQEQKDKKQEEYEEQFKFSKHLRLPPIFNPFLSNPDLPNVTHQSLGGLASAF